MPSIPVDVVTTVVYGTAATIIGVVTIYQSYIAWRLWREHHHHHSGQSSQDVELALGSARVVQQTPLTIGNVDVLPTRDMANQFTASVPLQPLGRLRNSTADSESVEVRNDSQDAASPGIALDAAVAPTLQSLQSPEPADVLPIQDTISTHPVANPEDPSVSCPALNPPDVPAGSSTTSHHTDDS